MPEFVGVFQVLAIPGQVFAGHADAGLFPIKPVQFVQVAEHNITQFVFAKLRTFRMRIDDLYELSKNPWATLRTSTDHQSVAVC